MKNKFLWILSKDNTAPFIFVALTYFLVLSSPVIYFLYLKGKPHTSLSVGLYEYKSKEKEKYNIKDSTQNTEATTKEDDFIDTSGTGSAQLNKFDDDEYSEAAEILTKNVHDWRKDADSRGFLMLTRLAVFFSICAFGAIGAAVSLITRTRNNESILNNITIKEILSIQTIGAIFACVLGLAFMGNMLAGSLFPNPSVFFRIIYIPSAFAKLLVWSFIAGFFERFVPNILNNFAKKAETQENTK